jgi:hypothetical protein
MTKQLRLDSVTIGREGNIAVTLLGEFKKTGSKSTKDLLDFLNSHDSMTID